jgi:hypothetical protein
MKGFSLLHSPKDRYSGTSDNDVYWFTRHPCYQNPLLWYALYLWKYCIASVTKKYLCQVNPIDNNLLIR